MIDIEMDDNASEQTFHLKDKVEDNTSDWQISDLYKSAWKIVKNNKLLWVLGAAGGAGSSFNFNFRKSFNAEDFNKLFNQNNNQSEQVNHVLGASANYAVDHLSQFLFSIPLKYYLILGLELFVLGFTTLIILLIYRSWSDATLIAATTEASHDKKVDLAQSAQIGFNVLKSFLWLDNIPSLIIIGVFFLVLFTTTLGLIFGSLLVKILTGIALVIGLILLIYALLILNVSLIWAKRKVIDQNQPAKSALHSGYLITKRKYWPSILLGLVNNIMTGVIGLIPVLILIGIFVGGFIIGFAAKNQEITIAIIITAILIGIIFAVGLTVLSGILNAFKATVWTLAYQKIKGKYDR